MRTIITSDFHIQENRLEDIASAMGQIADFGIDKKVDWIWVLGDIFNVKKPSPLCRKVLDKWIKKITKHNIKVLIIEGNHELGFKISGVRYLHTLEIPNVFVRNSPFIFSGQYYLGHHGVQESKVGIQNINLKNEISVNNLIEKYPKVKAYFLGHIHKLQKVNSKPLVMHTGSIEKMDFGERSEEKGFIYLDNGKLQIISLITRSMVQIDLTADNLIVPSIPKGSIVKVVFTGKKSEIKNIDEKEIIKQIPEPKSLKIVYNPIRESISRSKIINESATPVSCFMEYSKIHNLDDETICIGKKIIEEN